MMHWPSVGICGRGGRRRRGRQTAPLCSALSAGDGALRGRAERDRDCALPLPWPGGLACRSCVRGPGLGLELGLGLGMNECWTCVGWEGMNQCKGRKR
jgi:hypothetical protein